MENDSDFFRDDDCIVRVVAIQKSRHDFVDRVKRCERVFDVGGDLGQCLHFLDGNCRNRDTFRFDW